MRKKTERPKKPSLLTYNLSLPYSQQPVFIRLVRRFLEHDLGRGAASLSYYMLFSLFPALILVTMLLDVFDLHPFMTDLLRGFIPQEVLNVLRTYMNGLPHIDGNRSNTSFLVGSLLLLIYFAMRTMNCLLRSLRTAYGYRMDRSVLKNQLSVFLMTLLLLFGIFLALGLLTVGRSVLEALSPVFHFSTAGIDLWNIIRFLLIAGILFGVLFLLYYYAPGRKYAPRQVLPGTLIASLSWVAFSVIYASYVETVGSGRYSVLYGALGTVVILLLWLYFSGFVILIGAEVNGIYLEMREEMVQRGVTVPQYVYFWKCGWLSKKDPKAEK